MSFPDGDTLKYLKICVSGVVSEDGMFYMYSQSFTNNAGEILACVQQVFSFI